MAINSGLVDRFTLLHLGSGFILHRVGVSFWMSTAISIAFEIVEQSIKEKVPSIFPHPTQDSTVNQVGDTLAVMAGWLLGRWIDG